MTTPTNPDFPYPASNAREFWIKCSKDDPDALEHWCGVVDSWFMPGTHMPQSHLAEGSNDMCGMIWRKKVQVPDGWEIVPEDYLWDGKSEMKACVDDGEFIKATWSNPVLISSAVAYSRQPDKTLIHAYIQPIYKDAVMAPTPPTPQESDLILAMLITGGFVSKEKVEQARAFVKRL